MAIVDIATFLIDITAAEMDHVYGQQKKNVASSHILGVRYFWAQI